MNDAVVVSVLLKVIDGWNTVRIDNGKINLYSKYVVILRYHTHAYADFTPSSVIK